MTSGLSLNLVRISGVLALGAAIGGLLVDPLWWILLPGAALLAAGLLMRPAFASEGVSRIGSLALAFALVASLLVTTLGWVRVAQLDYEPAWIGRWSTWTGLGIVIGASMLGTGLAARGRHSIALGAVVGGALPLGLAIDWLTARVLPAGIFFAEVGFTVGLILFAIGLIKLGRRDARPRVRRHALRLGATAPTLPSDPLAS